MISSSVTQTPSIRAEMTAERTASAVNSGALRSFLFMALYFSRTARGILWGTGGYSTAKSRKSFRRRKVTKRAGKDADRAKRGMMERCHGANIAPNG